MARHCRQLTDARRVEIPPLSIFPNDYRITSLENNYTSESNSERGRPTNDVT